MQPGTTFKGGVIDRRIKERIIDHNKHAKNSHILKYSREEGHSHVGTKFSKYLEKNYSSSFHRKISEALFIKELKPSLRVCLHETRNEISKHNKGNSVCITFHRGRNEMDFVLGVVRDKRPIKAH